MPHAKGFMKKSEKMRELSVRKKSLCVLTCLYVNLLSAEQMPVYEPALASLCPHWQHDKYRQIWRNLEGERACGRAPEGEPTKLRAIESKAAYAIRERGREPRTSPGPSGLSAPVPPCVSISSVCARPGLVCQCVKPADKRWPNP